MQKDRIESIYFLRLFAMLMVVLVHTTGVFQSVFSEGSTEFGIYHFINRIIRLEAGIFIMITAMVFFYKYMDEKMTVSELKDYYKKRALYIVVPYLLWALFYEAFSLYIGAVPLNFAEMTWRIIQGESFYQLHFIFLIVQFYLVFPIILFVAQKVPVFRKYMWVFGIAIEIGYYFFDQTFQLIPFSIFLSSLGPYLLGAWIGTYYKEQRSLIYKKTNAAWAVFALAAGVTTVFLHYHLYTVSTFALPGYIYLVMNLSYILSGSYILFRLTEVVCDKWPGIIPYVQRVAVYSFGFYLLHPFILKVVAQFIPAPEGYWFHVFILLRYVSTIVLCYLVIWLTHKYFLRPGLIFGKLPRTAPSILESPEISMGSQRTGT
ncbi:Surface polysaccharide O-acyltransferase, integral membrane enzyme [Halobacillus alkaliphilus]|uniref:Surface polysaccharide O-acyltransferase, integral membrane enzyme n=1 Tax=Halobacillus alkaliphilus TaxID=396056 RepID=A0A1I2N4H0_9BACI|nr:acyltransferase [Halobacillus alkaliphilus]SFF98000.1 Surface polysaccharide O-acyltransferase, integral membrane enzyme [Halobacillus alkaliphilus]